MSSRLTSSGGHGFVLTWARLLIVVVIAAALSSIVTTLVLQKLVSGKVSIHDQTTAFRKGCQRNVGTVRDITRVAKAEIVYKSAVLRAASVKSDVKDAVIKAREAYTQALPGLESRIIDCNLAFPAHGKPKVVRVK